MNSLTVTTMGVDVAVPTEFSMIKVAFISLQKGQFGFLVYELSKSMFIA